MSIKVMSLVWDYSAASGADLLMMIALADWSDDTGKSIYPSVPTIAKKLRINNSRTIQRGIKRLIASKELSVNRSAHRMSDNVWTNEYEINVKLLVSRGDKLSPGGFETTPLVVSKPPNPSVYPSDKNCAKACKLTDSCNEPQLTLLPATSANSERASYAQESESAVPRRAGHNGKKQRDPLMDHPAVKVCHEITKLWPNEIQRKMIADADLDLGEWTTAVTGWMANGWKPTNIPGMIQKYQSQVQQPPADAVPTFNGIPRPSPDHVLSPSGEWVKLKTYAEQDAEMEMESQNAQPA